MKIYSNVYNYAVYIKLLWMAQIFFQIKYFEKHLCFEMYFLTEQFI